MNLIRWFTQPAVDTEKDRRNFLNVQVDAIGVGLANAASPFLPVFLTRLGASNFQVSLLTSMPAATGFVLALFLGRFLQTRKNIIPWFSAARLIVILCYAATGLVTILVPAEAMVTTVLVIWAFATFPQTIVAIAFSVVMNAVAGPKRRYDLMSRRWAILGFTSAISVLVIGQVLDNFPFPVNYQAAFMFLSLGGLISFYFSSHIDIPDSHPMPPQPGISIMIRIKEFVHLIESEKPFISFITKRLVYLTGVSMLAPLFPLYFVRKVEASDAWIGLFSTVTTFIMIPGYFFWLSQSRKRGSRIVLLLTTFGIAIYPALVSATTQVWMIAIFAGLAGFFQSGLDLVFFDELMKTVPDEYSAIFVSFAQSLQYFSAILAPGIGSLIADQIGLGGGLLIGAAIRFTGFLMFWFGNRSSNNQKNITLSP